MEQLGIEPKLLLAQIVNFLIIAFVLTKLLYKPILAMLEKRKKEIAEGLALTEKMRIAEEKSKEKEAKLLADARTEARTIIEEAEKEAEALKKSLAAEAQHEAAAIVEKGRRDVEELRLHMEKNVKQAAVSLAQGMARRLLSQVMTADMQHKVIAKHLQRLESMKE